MRIIIELDGIQHFKDMPYWKSFCTKQRQTDVHKMNCANEKYYCVIRLLQEDVLKDKINWKKMLDKAILDANKSDNVINQYISVTDIYSDHINDLECIDDEVENIKILK
jgi:very-short-patch-repair endonuclease